MNADFVGLGGQENCESRETHVTLGGSWQIRPPVKDAEMRDWISVFCSAKVMIATNRSHHGRNNACCDSGARASLRRVLVTVAAMATTSANAADWRYCLAPALGERKLYLSEPFETDEPMATVTRAFARVLMEAGLAHGEIQCPRSDSGESALMMRDYTIDFNRKNRNEIVEVPGKP